MVRENGSSRDFVVGQFENTNVPTILINFTSSADALAAVKDIDTAANNPTMVVNEIETGVDDDDNTVYTINGYFNGAEVSLTTTKNAVLGKLNNKGKNNGIIADQGGSKFYSTTDIWNAQSGAKLTDYLSEGDYILYDGGDRIVLVLDADDVYKQVYEGKTVADALPFVHITNLLLVI